MGATTIDGTTLARQVRDELRTEVDRLRSADVEPGLAVILVGDDPASESYVRGKTKAAQELGMRSETLHLPATTTEPELMALIDDLNHDGRWHGILVQMPLPPQISESAAAAAVSTAKDVDGLHPAIV